MMAGETQTLIFEKAIDVPPAQVYRAFTNSTALREWMCNIATTDPKVGGRVYMAWNSGFYTAGHYNKLEKDQEIAFTWYGRGEPGITEVVVVLAPADGGTRLHLEHRGLGTNEEWASMLREARQGWEEGLGNLASVLETGEDLRFINRPMLGIGLSDFDEKIAQQLGVPVNVGVRIDNTIEGMGAAAAGLQANDLIVSMANVPVTDYPSLIAALSGQKAGDTVEVIYYRGAEKQTVNMKLSRRPLREIPWDAGTLAEAVNKGNAEFNKMLEELLKGVTEEEASFKPTPTEWSIKEVIAHLIHSERGGQNDVADLLKGQERIYDDNPGNVQAHVEATIATYPTLASILAEYHCASQETVELLARLPDEFVMHKGSFWRIAYNILEDPFHKQTHLEQMRAALQAARGG